MKLRLALLAVAGGALLTAGFATAQADRKPRPEKTAICHKTNSQKKPYVLITVSNRALAKHRRHSQDIIPAPAGGCPSQTLTPVRGGRPLGAVLSGANGGDPDGVGRAKIRATRGLGALCFQLHVRNIKLPATDAHIHRGSTTEIVVPLTAPDALGKARGCVNVSRALVEEVLTTPSAFYVNVHTTDFPDGAVRGNLSR